MRVDNAKCAQRVREGDPIKVIVLAPVAVRGQEAILIGKRRGWHPFTKYVVQLQDGTTLYTGSVKRIRADLR